MFAVVTYATVAFGRSVSMIPNYSRATQAAKRIIALQARQSRIDPDAIDTGLKLVKTIDIMIYAFYVCSRKLFEVN